MRTRRAVAAAGLLLLAGTSPLSPLAPRRRALLDLYKPVPLGRVRVTHYTHHECGSRLTASGYVLKNSDAGRVCAVSRDWWRKRIKPGDLIYLPRYGQTCAALDTMALRNPRGLRQTHWIDVYYTDRQKALDFGIQHAQAFLLRPREKLAHARRQARAR